MKKGRSSKRKKKGLPSKKKEKEKDSTSEKKEKNRPTNTSTPNETKIRREPDKWWWGTEEEILKEMKGNLKAADIEPFFPKYNYLIYVYYDSSTSLSNDDVIYYLERVLDIKYFLTHFPLPNPDDPKLILEISDPSTTSWANIPKRATILDTVVTFSEVFHDTKNKKKTDNNNQKNGSNPIEKVSGTINAKI